MTKLKAIHSIWNKKNPIAPGSSFECNDLREVDRLVSSGAASIDENIATPIPTSSPSNIIPPDAGISAEVTLETDTVAVESESLTIDSAQTSVMTEDTVDTVEPDAAFKIPGIVDTSIVKILTAAGIDSIEKAKQLTKEQLVAVPGLGYNNAQKVFKALK